MSTRQPEIVEAVRKENSQPEVQRTQAPNRCWCCLQAYRSGLNRILIESLQSHADDRMAIHPSVGG